MSATTSAELEAILRMTVTQRFELFVQSVVDEQQVWGLQGPDGWTLMTDPDGSTAFALWPGAEFAARCAMPGSSETPGEIPIDVLMEELLPQLEKEGAAVAVFPAPWDKGSLVPVKTLRAALEEELNELE